MERRRSARRMQRSRRSGTRSRRDGAPRSGPRSRGRSASAARRSVPGATVGAPGADGAAVRRALASIRAPIVDLSGPCTPRFRPVAAPPLPTRAGSPRRSCSCSRRPWRSPPVRAPHRRRSRRPRPPRRAGALHEHARGRERCRGHRSHVGAGGARGRAPVHPPRPAGHRSGEAGAAAGLAARVRRHRRDPGGLPEAEPRDRRARDAPRRPRRHDQRGRQAVLERDRRVLRAPQHGGRLRLHHRGHRRREGGARRGPESGVPDGTQQRRLHVVPHGLRPRGRDRGDREHRGRDVRRSRSVHAERPGGRPRGPRHR